MIGPDPLNDLPNASHYSRLKYAEAVVLETMRMQPPAYMVGRCCAEDVFIAGGKYALPKGTTVLIAPYLLHNDARYWDAPGEFRPERWLEPGGVPKGDAATGVERGAGSGGGGGGGGDADAPMTRALSRVWAPGACTCRSARARGSASARASP